MFHKVLLVASFLVGVILASPLLFRGCRVIECGFEQRADDGALMASIDVGESLFKEACVKDRDGDGVGEYATLEELCAWAASMPAPH